MSAKVDALKKIFAEHPARRIVLATYLRSEFEELRPGDNYDRFKREERELIEELAREGLQGIVAFQLVDSVGYYRYLAKKELPNNNTSRAAYAAEKYNQEHPEPENPTFIFDPERHIRFGLLDENGGVYAASKYPFADVFNHDDEDGEDEQVILFPNPTWEPSDWSDDTDPDYQNWIMAERLGEMFTENIVGLNPAEIASRFSLPVEDINDMMDGLRPIPEEIWKEVERMHVELLTQKSKK